jgi:hypothetical protein
LDSKTVVGYIGVSHPLSRMDNAPQQGPVLSPPHTCCLLVPTAEKVEQASDMWPENGVDAAVSVHTLHLNEMLDRIRWLRGQLQEGLSELR